jgi:hypothetical protein
MKQGLSIARFEPKYDAFLFTSLGDDRNGMPLAVASLLGRMNLDPWHEAAALAALPTDLAAQKLASLIDAMPDQLLTHPESATLAARLITLLPPLRESEAAGPAPITGTSTGAGAETSRGTFISAICFALFFILLLAAAFANASRVPAQSLTMPTPSLRDSGRPIS